jgi:hypothetical protein
MFKGKKATVWDLRLSYNSVDAGLLGCNTTWTSFVHYQNKEMKQNRDSTQICKNNTKVKHAITMSVSKCVTGECRI